MTGVQTCALPISFDEINNFIEIMQVLKIVFGRLACGVNFVRKVDIFVNKVEHIRIIRQ